jgi:hypothetical protein
MPNRFCVICGKPFEARTPWQRYCSKSCETKNYRHSHGLWLLKDGRFCRQCGKKFYPVKGENNKQHCSPECAAKSARESRSKFWEKYGDKKHEKMVEYHATSRTKKGPDSNLKRFYARFPDAPRACQACGETRVLEIAHKPEFARNGAWRSKENTTLDKVWILCPTCHKLIDRMGYDPKSLGLS